MFTRQSSSEIHVHVHALLRLAGPDIRILAAPRDTLQIANEEKNITGWRDKQTWWQPLIRLDRSFINPAGALPLVIQIYTLTSPPFTRVCDMGGNTQRFIGWRSESFFFCSSNDK